MSQQVRKSPKDELLYVIECTLGQIRLMQIALRNNQFVAHLRKYPSPLEGLSQVVLWVTRFTEQRKAETFFAHALIAFNSSVNREREAPLIPGDFRTLLLDPLPSFTQMASGTVPPTLSELSRAEQYCIRLNSIIRGIDEKYIH